MISPLCLCKRSNNEMGRMEASLARDIVVRRRVNNLTWSVDFPGVHLAEEQALYRLDLKHSREW